MSDPATQESTTASTQPEVPSNPGTVDQNPDVNKLKDQPAANTNTGDPTAPPATEEKKESGFFDLVLAIPKAIWNHVLLPVFEFIKEGAMRFWGWAVATYRREVECFNQMGAMKYLIDRIGKTLILGAKLAAIAVVAYYIDMALMNYMGVSLFDPFTIGVILLIAFACIVIRSYMDQKKAGAEFSAKTTGVHLIQAIAGN